MHKSTPTLPLATCAKTSRRAIGSVSATLLLLVTACGVDAATGDPTADGLTAGGAADSPANAAAGSASLSNGDGATTAGGTAVAASPNDPNVGQSAGTATSDGNAGGKPNQVEAGGAGSDTEAGGAGSDTEAGGAGSDTEAGGAGSDTEAGGAGSDTEAGGAGSDTEAGGAPAETGGSPADTEAGGAPGEEGDTWDNYASGFFVTYCFPCHDDGGVGAAKGLYYKLEDVTTFVEGIACGVTLSEEYRTTRGCSATPRAGQFPAGSNMPEDAERERLIAWIDAGMP